MAKALRVVAQIAGTAAVLFGGATNPIGLALTAVAPGRSVCGDVKKGRQ